MCTVKIGRLGKFDLNPRGELWRKDENRFGHKLLSKFGWTQGKGLGKNEDGIAENLKVRIKLGNTGVGWDEKLPIGIDYREYDAVLEDLSKKYQKPSEVKIEGVSLEKRSQQFKNRIHYQKFVRGKDISRYSEKDMSCIFLSKEPVKEMESTPKELTVSNIESCPVDSTAEESMPTYNSQMSIADYFAIKMKNKLGSNLNAPKSSQICEESSQSEVESKSKKRKHMFKSSKKAKRVKQEPELTTAEESLTCIEEITSESSSSSQEAPEEIPIIKQEPNILKELVKKKKKGKVKKFLNALESNEDIEENHQDVNNVLETNSTEDKNFEPWEQSSKSTDKSNNFTKLECTSKKRKKEIKSRKKAKKHCFEEAEISAGVEKNSSHSESDTEEKKSLEDCTMKSTKTDKQSTKESKKHKNKVSKLKSCLKSCLSNNKYSFKEKRKVSFCENISYKLIENVLNNFDSDVVLETNEQLLSCSDEDYTDSEVSNEIETRDINHVDDSNTLGNPYDIDVQCDGEDVSCSEYSGVTAEDVSCPVDYDVTAEDVSCPVDYDVTAEDVSCPVNSDLTAEDNTVPECFKLPKLSSTNYDSWLETQRIAAQMKLYKNMVKKMKKHPVLRKTNLLDIKGYGNWGL